MNTTNKISLVFAYIFMVNQALAGGGSCNTINSGNWSDPAIWDCDGTQIVPDSSGSVTINNGHTVLLDMNAVVNNLSVAAGGDLNVASSATGLSLSWNAPGSDLSNASIDLAGDFTIKCE